MSNTRLWDKGLPLDEAVHRFTVGDDWQTDLQLVYWDALGSAAHARMLAEVGLLESGDAAALVAELETIAHQGLDGTFVIEPEQEDVHTAIEAALCARLGQAGRRIHLGRSRNDQVQTALRLYMRRAVLELASLVGELAGALLTFAERHRDLPLPGYTHLRRAMPSSFGMWAAAPAEALLEELEALQAVDRRLDRCPLGAAAGFGTSLPIDRARTAELLGFSRVQRSPVDAISSRGRHEVALVGWACSVATTLEKLLWDVALMTTEEFGLLRLPDGLTTGSSIMPQKRNPDVVELARGRCRELRGQRALLEHVAGGLPSSYHRDVQLLKAPLFAAAAGAAATLDATARVVRALTPVPERAQAACTDELYAAAAAYALVVDEGLPFRDAYAAVGAQVTAGTFEAPRGRSAGVHVGSLGRLELSSLRDELAEHGRHWSSLEAGLQRRWGAVWDPAAGSGQAPAG